LSDHVHRLEVLLQRLVRNFLCLEVSAVKRTTR
jgi:hypothetical protein